MGSPRGRSTLTVVSEFHLFYLCSEYSGDTEFARAPRMIDPVETWICNLTRLDETRVRADMQSCLKGREKQRRIFSLLDRIYYKFTASRLHYDPYCLFLCVNIYIKEPGGSPFCRRGQKYVNLLILLQCILAWQLQLFPVIARELLIG